MPGNLEVTKEILAQIKALNLPCPTATTPEESHIPEHTELYHFVASLQAYTPTTLHFKELHKEQN